MTLKVNFVAAGKRIWSGDADMVIAPGFSGDFGILKGHESMVTLLCDGIIKVSSHDENMQTQLTNVKVEAGFLSCCEDEVSIVTDSAEIL
ncbi:MAG: F0F1 ATP synthase subunit epsilon [Candidatus Ancillula sp.]|jgi:F-type H+-transporting ATPase subunit epsilon|nr:F0F1 ATP synthase subunit epsilon [Candidatus Ancillula sp.]